MTTLAAIPPVHTLQGLETATRLLAESRSVDEVKTIRDQAEAMRLYARARDMGIEAQNHAAEIKLRAERRLGELLADMPKNEGARGVGVRFHDETTPTYRDLGIDKNDAYRWQEVASVPADDFEARIAEAKAAAQPISTAYVTHNSGQNEWYTPAAIIEAARAVLGGIDLDPASHPDAQTVVKATRYYTRDEDGLHQRWHGRVWLNPPYAQPLIGQFCAKLTEAYAAGDVAAAIALTNNGTETEWGQTLLGAASAVCFPDGRVKFWAPDRVVSAPLQGQMICYFGDAPELFCERFGGLGVVLGATAC